MDRSASADSDWTVRRILRWTTDYLETRGVEAARLEAELLCAHARRCPRIRLYTDYDVPLTETERSRMREAVRRRAAREPLAYIIGEREFYGRTFHVVPGVLIPRPETETLIDLALEQIPDDRPAHLVEAGFGSGCIAVTLAVQKPQCRVTACDISAVCGDVARQNAARFGVADRIRFLHADASAALADIPDASVDGFLSNPPYVRTDELDRLQPEVAQYEPREALVSGPDGLDLIRQLIPHAARILRPSGWIGLECDPAQCRTIQALLTEHGLAAPTIFQDFRGTDRIVTAQRPSEPTGPSPRPKT